MGIARKITASAFLLFFVVSAFARADGLEPLLDRSTQAYPLIGGGAVLRVRAGYAEVVSLVPGGAAEADGRLKAGDRIVAVTQDHEAPVDAVGMDLKQLVDLIRGPQGSRVTLTEIPAEGGSDAPLKLKPPAAPAAP